MTGERDDIWLYVHRLSAALDDAGLTREERLGFAMNELERMPPTVRREMLRELSNVAGDLLDLHPLVVAAQNQAEQRPAPQLHAG
jgi:hypothetical protein